MRNYFLGLLLLILAGSATAADWKVIHEQPDRTMFLADFESAQALGANAIFWLKIDSRLAKGATGGVYVMKTELRCVDRTWGWLAWSNYDFNEKIKDSRTQPFAKQNAIEPDSGMDFVRKAICAADSLAALNMKRRGAGSGFQQ